MPAVSSNDLIRLRSQPHRSDLYLIIHQPSTILSATVSSVADNNTEITVTGAAYGTDASGAAWVVGDLVADLTVWVGASAGAKDRGTVRFKSVLAGDPPTSIEVAENDDIDWSSAYITVVDEFRVWPVLPRTPLQTPPTDVDWYADYDVAYSDQNEKFVPIPIMGPSSVGFLDGATITFRWDGSASYTIRTGAAIGAHAWTSQSGTVINGATATPSIRYNYATGHTGDRNTLKVTDDQGVDAKDYTGHRHAFTMSRTGANAPYGAGDTEIALLAFGGSWDEGGYSMEVEVRDGTDDGSGRPDADKFQDGNMAILFSEDFFGRTSGSVGSLQYREPICLVGYIMGDSVTQNARTGAVTFTAQTINGVLNRCDMYPIALEDATTVQTDEWYKMENLDIQRVLHHLFVYHSTVPRCADLFLPDYSISGSPWINQGHTAAAGWEFAQQSLYSMANATVMQSAVAGKCASDKFSRLFMEKDIQVLDDGNYPPTNLNERVGIPTVMGLLKQDQREPLEIEEASEAVTSQVRLSGVYWPGGGIEDDPDLDDLEAYFSYAPGDCMKTRGTGRDQANLALDSQEQANTMSGMLLAKDNNRYPVLQVPLTGNYRVFDIIPQEYVTMSLAAGDTNRGIVWTDQKLVVRGIEYEYMAKPGTLLTTLLLEPETTGKPGETITFPDQPPPDEPYEPPEPPEPPGPDPVGNGEDVVVVLDMASGSDQIWLSSDFRSASPTWVNRDSGLSGVGTIHSIKIDPFHTGRGESDTVAFLCTDNGIWTTSNLATVSWVQVLDSAQILTDCYAGAGTISAYNVRDLVADSTTPGWAYAVINVNHSSDAGVEAHNGRLWGYETVDYGASWTFVVAILSDAGGGPDPGRTYANATPGCLAISPVNASYLYLRTAKTIGWDNYWLRSITKGNSWVYRQQMAQLNTSLERLVMADPWNERDHLLGHWGGDIIQKSTDGLSTDSVLISLPALGYGGTFRGMARSPLYPSEIFCFAQITAPDTTPRLFRTATGAAPWTVKTLPARPYTANSWIEKIGGEVMLYMGRDGEGVYLSEYSGDSWENKDGDLFTQADPVTRVKQIQPLKF